MGKVYKLSLRTIIILASVILLSTATAAYASFNLIGTGQINVTPPVVGAVFISGEVGNQQCTVSSSGSTLTCPDASVQQGNTETLIFSVKNVGTIEVNLGIQVIPNNSSVLSVVPSPSDPTTLAVGSTGIYAYGLIGIGIGNSGFTIDISPAPLPPQAA